MSRRLRVVHIAATANGAPWMHAMMRDLATRGHDVSAVIAGRDGDLAPKLERDGLPYHVLDLNILSSRTPLAAAGKIVALARLLRRLRPDVLHTHLFPSIVIGRLAGWVADVPVRLSMIPGPYYLEAPILGDIERGTAWADTAVIASCERTRELYLAGGTPARQLELIYYGADPRVFDPARADGARVRRELGVPPGTPTVGIVAYFYPPLPKGPYTPAWLAGRGVKGHDILLRAVPRVLASVPDATFLLVGEGWGAGGHEYEQRLRTMAEELGVAHAVRFTGARRDIPDTLAAFDVSVQCSRSENLGGSIESLLMGRPFVATAVGGLVDAVRHEETGLLVPPEDPEALGDAIARLLLDRALAATVAARGRARALEQFTLGRTVDAVDELYRRKADEVSPSHARAPRARRYRLSRSLVRALMLPARTGALLSSVLVAPRRFRSIARRLLTVPGARAGAGGEGRPGTSPPIAPAITWSSHLSRRASPLWRAVAGLRPSFAGPTAGLAPSWKVLQIAGGTDNAEWFVDIARELRLQGYDVSAVIGEGEGRLAGGLRAAGVPYRSMPLSFAPDLGRMRVLVYLVRVPWAVFRLARLMRRERAAVVHTHIFNTIFIGRLAAWIAGVPCRVSMVPGPLHLDAALTRTADRLTWWLDHRVVAGCEATRDRYARLGLRPPRLACIGYGVDPSRFDPARADAGRIRREYAIAPAAPVVGLVAYFYPPRAGWHQPPYLRDRGVKGHEDFIAAARLVRERRPDARFVLVGSGWGAAGERYRRRLVERCQAEGLGDAVIFTGWRQDVADLLAAFDVAVQCSLSENYGGTIEALLMERPTVATRVGGMPETIRHGETGLLVPPRDPAALADAVLTLIDGPARGQAMGRAGRRLMLERHQISHTARSIAALYETVLYRPVTSTPTAARSA